MHENYEIRWELFQEEEEEEEEPTIYRRKGIAEGTDRCTHDENWKIGKPNDKREPREPRNMITYSKSGSLLETYYYNCENNTATKYSIFNTFAAISRSKNYNTMWAFLNQT